MGRTFVSDAFDFGSWSCLWVGLKQNQLQKRRTGMSDPHKNLPAPGLHHAGFIHCGDSQAFHRTVRVLADFK